MPMRAGAPPTSSRRLTSIAQCSYAQEQRFRLLQFEPYPLTRLLAPRFGDSTCPHPYHLSHKDLSVRLLQVLSSSRHTPRGPRVQGGWVRGHIPHSSVPLDPLQLSPVSSLGRWVGVVLGRMEVPDSCIRNPPLGPLREDGASVVPRLGLPNCS